MANETLGWRIPIEVLTGLTPDISPLLHFYFYEPVLYKRHEYLYLSESNEREGFYVGPTQNVGHKLCFKILTKDTGQIIYWSSIRLALSPCHQNLCLINQARGEKTDGSNYIFISMSLFCIKGMSTCIHQNQMKERDFTWVPHKT